MSLPEFARVMWSSRHAREVWAPRVQAVSRAWQAAEVASVQHGLRAACLQAIAPDGLPALAARAAAAGLVALPLERQAASGEYSVSQQPAGDGPWEYRVAVCQPHVVDLFARAWTSERRDEEVGVLLGFPACCRAFFQRVWVEQCQRDTTWAMEPNQNVTQWRNEDERCTTGGRWFNKDGPPEANILLRWIGVRLVPHLPCGFMCTDTVRQGRLFAGLLPALERAWAYELLSWPMRWTARHGIAELETPCFKVNMTTDVSHEFRELRRSGIAPPEGATGVRFPYNVPTARPSVNRLTVIDQRAWTDNGFTSLAAMDEAHAMVIAALPPGVSAVLDLGAGNGRLLERIGCASGIGIEHDAERAARGRKAGRPIERGRIQDVCLTGARRFDVALISARRLEELAPSDVERLRGWLVEHVTHVLLYSYDSPRFARLIKPAQLQIGVAA